MAVFAGILVGGALIIGVIAFALRYPSKPTPRRNDSDHGGWNDTNSSSSNINLGP